MPTTRRLAAVICGRHAKWIVLAIWLAVTAGLGVGLGSQLADEEDNATSSWLPDSAESTEALRQTDVFQSENTFPTTIVYERSGGLTGDDLATIRADIDEYQTYDGSTLADIVGDDVTDGDTAVSVDGPIRGPIVSADGQAAQVEVPINAGTDGLMLLPDLVGQMRDTAAADANGMVTHATGPGGSSADNADAWAGIDGVLLVAALIVVVAILLLTYRSPILWLFPILTAIFAMLNAQGIVYLLSKYADLTVNAQAIGILTVLVIGAGTDYAMLLVARYREELRRHHDRHEAMAEALHRAAPAIVASASTVALGMLCLMAADMNSTAGMGPVAAVGVVVALLAMVSLLPALLVIMGRWIFWPVRPHEGSAEPTASGFWARTGRVISRRPRLVWIGTTVALGVMALGVIGLDAKGLPAADQYRDTPDSIAGDTVLRDHFASDPSSPLQIVTNADAADRVVAATRDIDGVDPEAVAPVGSVRGKTMIEAGITDPVLSDAAYQTVQRVRDAVHDVPGADVLVGGTAAVNWDVQEASRHDNNLVIPLVLGLVFLILVILLRALVAPLLLMGTVVLAFGAALGVSALAFEYVFGVSGADSSLPLYVFVFLVALGIDYNIFLMTRVREEAARAGSRRGALIGLAATGGVITSAGLVLAGTFGTLATLPLTFTLQIGFAVAFGVLLDTFIVRSVLVTALNLDLGRRMWWPSRLGRDDGSDDDDRPTEKTQSAQPAGRVTQEASRQ
jgi:RND superfamily putative drug exporter